MRETALAYVRHRGNSVAMAAELHVHPQTARYRIARLRELFGDAARRSRRPFRAGAGAAGRGAQRRRMRGSVLKTASQSGEETPKP